MSNNNNIEDIFQSGFKGFTKKPSEDVWSGINKQMLGPRMETMYKTAFNGFRINPSKHVWKRIAAFVWINKFVHFSPFSFNIYYLAVITTFIVGTGITINNNYNKEFVHFSEDTYNISKQKTIKPIENRAFVEYLSLRDASTKNFELKDDSNDNYVNNLQAIDNTKTENNNIIAQNSTQENSSIEKNSDKTKTIYTATQKEDVVENIINSTEKLSASTINNQKATDFNLKKLAILKHFNLTYSPDILDIADAVINGIPVLYEIKHDTVGSNYLGDPIIVEKSYFSFDLYFSTYLHNYSTTLLNTELSATHEFYKNNINTTTSFSTGIGFAYSYKKLRFETGLGYHRLNESLIQKNSSYANRINEYYDYSDNNTWQTQTILILDLDEYLQGNTVYIAYIDSLLITNVDSSLVSYTDSVQVVKHINANNSYHFVEIPIILGYEFVHNNISVTPKTGIISSMLINRTGSYYNIMDNRIDDPSVASNTKFLFDYYAAVNIQYKLNKNIALYIEPHIRGDINSMYKDNYAISQKSRKYGIKTGIYFKF